MRQPINDIDFVLPGDGVSAARHTAGRLGAEFYPLDTERGTGRVALPKLDREASRLRAMRGRAS